MPTEKERRNLEKGKPSWKVFLIAFSFLIGMAPLFLYFFYRNHQRKAIRRDQAFTTATITQFEHQSWKGRNWYKTFATYQIGTATFTCTGKATGTLTPEQRHLLIGTRLPVIYESVNPSNGELLSSERQFDRFNLNFPDSLAWTKSYFLE